MLKRFLVRAYDWVLCRAGITGDFSRHTFDPTEVQFVAVALQGAGHTGIAYRSIAGQLLFLHYPNHDRTLRNQDCLGLQLAYSIPLLKEEDLKFLAGFCALVHDANRSRKLPYNFEFDPAIGFSRDTGLVVFNFDQGFTCSTFVVAFFRSAGNALVRLITWPRLAGPDDIAARTYLLNAWRNSGRPELALRADIIEPTIQTMRVSPAQVAGACLQKYIPTGYFRAKSNGDQIVARLGP